MGGHSEDWREGEGRPAGRLAAAALSIPENRGALARDERATDRDEKERGREEERERERGRERDRTTPRLTSHRLPVSAPSQALADAPAVSHPDLAMRAAAGGLQA